jgi:hypothetical protein
MAEAIFSKDGKHVSAKIRRIVPGKLVYVETNPEEVYAIKLDNILIQKSDGLFEHYRGEPLSTLGLDSGKSVMVWTDSEGSAPRNLVVDARPASRSIFGSTFSNVTEYFKRG